LTPEELTAIWYDWYGWWARESQQVPAGKWRTWLVLAGRGFGKTRCGAEYIRWRVETGQARRVSLVARTKADIRDVMIEGESGILAISAPHFMPEYEPSKRRITWPNGAFATLFSADEPDQLRGPQCDTYWADELASWRRAETWDNLVLGARLGLDVRGIVTTTPKRTDLFRRVVKKAGLVITGGSTYENLENLPDDYKEEILAAYEGTRLGQQELYATLLEDNPDALWRYETMIENRRRPVPDDLRRIVVAVDPEAASREDSAETGIIVAGRGFDRHLYILADYTIRGTPAQWGKEVARAYHTWKADMIVGEVNNGGDMVEHVIRTTDAGLPFKAVRATRGKLLRAEPIAAIYERGLAHHCNTFPELETQMTQWMPGERSPDRLDALVWAGTELMLGNRLTYSTALTTGARFPGERLSADHPGFQPPALGLDRWEGF
jgi:phage terminase large subunit-like protein